MGQPRFSLLEMIDHCNLPVMSGRMVMNLNTFHTKDELDNLLNRAAQSGIDHLLIVRGDGGPLLSKLDALSIGGTKSVATSIDLIRYVNTEYSGAFSIGAAYNQYNAMPFESSRLSRKIEAGADFVVTQPVIGRDENVDALFQHNIPVVVEAWMSKNIDLFLKSVRSQKPIVTADYNPMENLQTLHSAYPQCAIYLSMLGFRQSWRNALPRLPV
jgi:methylenetetrahydrofolate reductase (NADPH)